MPETTSTCGNKQSGFFSLPLELREKIYSHLLLRTAIIVQVLQFKADPWIKSAWDNPERHAFYENIERSRSDVDSDAATIAFSEPVEYKFLRRKCSILSASRQISEEALNILYGRNIFIVSIHSGAHTKLLNFGIANIQRIRYLSLVAQPMGICYPVPMNFDSQLWLPLLADLNQLYLIVQQPLRELRYYNAPSLSEEVQEWVTWLGPIFRYLAQSIERSTDVGVDDDDMVETRELVDNYFHSGYKKIKAEAGDRIFQRGMFSRDFGPWGDDDPGMNFADDDWPIFSVI